MTDERENDSDRPEPIHGQVRYSQVSARVPEEIGTGEFASALMVMTGPFEVVLDFILRLSEAPRVVTRVVLSPAVIRQFVKALKQNIANYEQNFGPLPHPPRVVQAPAETDAESNPEPPSADPETPADASGPTEEGEGPAPPPWSTHPPGEELLEPSLVPPAPPNIEQIYDELRLPDSLLSGRYANAVLIRHSGTEFCFDFITNIFPRSSVSARVYMAAANIAGLLDSLRRAIEQRPG